MRTAHLTKALLAVSLLLCLTASAARAAEAETHLLNEALSLTGNCSKGSLDTIEDPGCPGGVHPSEPLAWPSNVTTDPHGDIYVGSQGPSGIGGGSNFDKGHVDVFDPSGHYLTELATPGIRALAVDAGGHLYVSRKCNSAQACYGEQFLRFDPTTYVPAAGEISYDDPPVELPLRAQLERVPTNLAVNPANQHLFASYGVEIQEFGPAPAIPGEPNAKLEEGIGASILRHPSPATGSTALDAAHGLLYVTDDDRYQTGVGGGLVRVFELAAPHNLVRTIDGSTIPQVGKLSGGFGVAAEEATGNVFVSDLQVHTVYEFEEDGSYVESFQHGFESERGYIHVDNSPESPNQGYLFVPAGFVTPGHLFAYQPKPEIHPPVVEAVSTTGVGRREAVLRAKVNPEAFETHYAFEYTTQASFEAEGFEGATLAGEGDLPPGLGGVNVSAPVSGLQPGAAYRFRVAAESQCEPGGCGEEAQGSFATFEAPQQGGSCENAALRTGPSASLPDCRAYELITPSDTNGHPPKGPVGDGGPKFGTPTFSADGNALAFRTEGGPVPGTNGAGAPNGDAYLATRTPSGWQTTLQGPSGEQNAFPSPGGLSPDLSYIAWTWGGDILKHENFAYIRYPDASFHLLGEGTLANDPTPGLLYIAPHGSHIIFNSNTQLVQGAPEAPAGAIYDRTPDEVLHVVSLLPGNVVPSAGATLGGRSDDGSSVAFTIGLSSPLYVRIDDAETIEGGPAGARFAGFSTDGRYLFYLSGGDFYRFDTETDETTAIAASGDAEPVNVPASGSGAYFLSHSDELAGEPNPNGAEAIEGWPNLYYWDGTEVRFLATLTAEDVKGEVVEFEGTPSFAFGFEEWMKKVGRGELGLDPTRASRQGSALLFRSRAKLTPYDNEGHLEIYRYDAGEGALACVSCVPTGSPPEADAKLATIGLETVLSSRVQLANLSEDGRRAFFESSERLVPADNDGTQDVYEWEAENEGSCRQAGGCLFLISSGQSARPSYFYGASASGGDVAFSTSDLLTEADRDETPSLYDARVEGGFAAAEGNAGECLGEACQPAASPPAQVTPASSAFKGAGNVKEAAQHKKKHKRRHAKKHHKTKSHSHGRPAR